MDRVFWFGEENTYEWCGTCERFVSAIISPVINHESEHPWKTTWCHGERYYEEKPESIFIEIKANEVKGLTKDKEESK
jgi:hypothetical protein